MRALGSNRELTVPQFLIERNFAEQLEVTKEAASAIKEVNDELSLRWVFSFLSADKKKTYCLYEAPSAEAIREAARRLNIPADKIIELGRAAAGDVCLAVTTEDVEFHLFLPHAGRHAYAGPHVGVASHAMHSLNNSIAVLIHRRVPIGITSRHEGTRAGRPVPAGSSPAPSRAA